jgi:hypothetical protein
VDEEARGMLVQANDALLVIGRILKNLLDDFPKNPHELILNWKELELACLDPLHQTLNNVHKKIVDFIQLLQMFL